MKITKSKTSLATNALEMLLPFNVILQAHKILEYIEYKLLFSRMGILCQHSVIEDNYSNSLIPNVSLFQRPAVFVDK